MKILIVGAGGVGFMLCEYLMNSHEVIVIDKNQNAISNINSQLDVLALNGDGKNPKTYEYIDKNIDIFIAVTNFDETNILSCLIVDEILNIHKKIIRLNNSFYSSASILKKLKINHVIYPINETLNRIKKILDFPHSQSIKTLENTDLILGSILIQNLHDPISIDSFLQNTGSLVCGIERQNSFLIPDENEQIYKNDLVYLISQDTHLEMLGQMYGVEYPKITNSIIFGADILGQETAKFLLQNGINVRIFEKDMKLCKKTQENLGEDASIYHIKYGLDHFSKDEMQNTQMLISTTEEDEYNIAKCLEAKHNNIPKVIGINSDPAYTKLMKNVGIQIVRGVKSSTFYGILEKLDELNIVFVKTFCANSGAILMRPAYGLLHSICVKDFNDKTKKLGLFFIIKNKIITQIEENSIIEPTDILLACTLTKNSKSAKKWLEKQF